MRKRSEEDCNTAVGHGMRSRGSRRRWMSAKPAPATNNDSQTSYRSAKSASRPIITEEVVKHICVTDAEQPHHYTRCLSYTLVRETPPVVSESREQIDLHWTRRQSRSADLTRFVLRSVMSRTSFMSTYSYTVPTPACKGQVQCVSLAIKVRAGAAFSSPK